jgi:hypothetical protein
LADDRAETIHIQLVQRPAKQVIHLARREPSR